LSRRPPRRKGPMNGAKRLQPDLVGSLRRRVAFARNLTANLARGVLDAAVPQTCAACGVWISGRTPMCPGCESEVNEAFALPYCHRCGRTLAPLSIHEDNCARCRAEAFWNVAGVARVGLYTPAIRALLVGLKYHGHERNTAYLAERLAAAIVAAGWSSELEALVPVPMHWLRRLQRPCDHAAMLAGELSRLLKLPVIRMVRRVVNSRSQTGMPTKAARFENVKGCFALARRHWPAWLRRNVEGKTVCIVDNLIMTGATVCEVSKVLRKAGARRIYAAAIARPAAPGDPPIAAFADRSYTNARA